MDPRPPPGRSAPAFAPEMEASLRFQAKAQLRKSVQRIRSTLPPSARAARSAVIRATMRDGEAFVGARSVALYSPILHKAEVDTRGLDADARALGLRVAYPALEDAPGPPRVDDEGRPLPPALTMTMTMRWVDDGGHLDEALVDRGHGFPEPSPDAPRVDLAALDVIVVPGLAFDPQLQRLGYGAGFYDRLLRDAPHGHTIGVAFDFQILAELPITDGDVALDAVVSDRRVLGALRRAGTAGR